jgi:ABC-type branched-subunit amino acid transport system substrate-binding protein
MAWMRWRIAHVRALSGVLACAIGAGLSASSQPGEFTPQEQRGQQIYLRGTSPSGQDITAVLSTDGHGVPAAAMACVNCHGHEGRGKPEGGVTPSNITWEALTKPYEITHPSGRKHPPYTERLLKRAITMGIDPAGHPLHVAMPRFQMSHQDLADMIAYLKRLGKNLDPGLSETVIRVGTILPSTHSQAEAGRAVKAALTAYFDEINQAGGIYNRRLESRFAASSDSPEELIATVRAFLADEPIFALIGSSAGGPEHDLARLVQEHEIPLISALALHPPASFPLNRYAFYLFSGLKEQARALAMFARKRYAQKNPRAAILFSDDAASRDIVQAIRAECSNAGWQAVEEMAIPRAQVDAARLAHRLSENATEIVFCLGSSGTEHRRLLQEAQKLNWTPLVFIPGSLASRDIFDLPVNSDGRLFLAFPTLPSDQTPASLAEYRRLAQTYKLPSQHVLAQLTALASASVLVEGLKRAGQALSREKLIETWEGFYKFKTGLTPALSYGPNRRTGARGAYIVSIDLVAKTLAPAGGWVEPN